MTCSIAPCGFPRRRAASCSFCSSNIWAVAMARWFAAYELFADREPLEWRRRAPEVEARGNCRDLVRSSRSHLVKAGGPRWISLNRAARNLGLRRRRRGLHGGREEAVQPAAVDRVRPLTVGGITGGSKQPRQKIFGVLTVATLAVVLACAGGEPLTIREYAEECPLPGKATPNGMI